MRHLFVICLSFFLISLSACKKEKNKAPTRAELLQQGKWKLYSAKYGGFIDLMEEFEDCQKDNLYTFGANHIIAVDEGETQCDNSPGQTYEDGTWQLQNNDNEITIEGSAISAGFGKLTGKLLRIDGSQFEVAMDTTISGYKVIVNVVFQNTK